MFTGVGGKLVSLKDTIAGFESICDGACDDMPEASFYMVGNLEEARDKAKQMAAEVA